MTTQFRRDYNRLKFSAVSKKRYNSDITVSERERREKQNKTTKKPAQNHIV